MSDLHYIKFHVANPNPKNQNDVHSFMISHTQNIVLQHSDKEFNYIPYYSVQKNESFVAISTSNKQDRDALLLELSDSFDFEDDEIGTVQL